MGRESEVPDPREHLLTRVLPFWARHSVDRDHGGFITHLDRDGTITDPGHKFLVTQSRMIYSFITGAALGGPADWRAIARQGVDFFLRAFRDIQYDGWFWSVTRQGRPGESEKRMYGHAFAIYALSEFARITGDSHALAAANHTWSLCAEYLWDRRHGGVIETCNRAWTPTNRGHSMGTHLHMLEALLALNDAMGRNQYWSHVRKVADLIVTHMVEGNTRCGLEHFHPDWSVDTERTGGLVDYGHNLEAAWLLLRVDRIEATRSYRHTAKGFLDYVLQFGLDTAHGGVFLRGPLGRPATVREKIWWVQCEALPAFLLGHLVFGDGRYREAFAKVVNFCLAHLHDAEYGDWYHSTTEDGTPLDTTKGSAWKAAYHVTQACAYTHEYLQEIR